MVSTWLLLLLLRTSHYIARDTYIYYRLIFICWNLILILFGDYLLDQHIWCYILPITGWILTYLVYLYFWWNTIWYLFAAADYFFWNSKNIFWKFIFAAADSAFWKSFFVGRTITYWLTEEQRFLEL